MPVSQGGQTISAEDAQAGICMFLSTLTEKAYGLHCNYSNQTLVTDSYEE